MPQGWWVVHLGAVLLATLLCTSAHAQSGSADRSYSLDYRAPATCPDAGKAREAIESRTSGASQVDAQKAAVHFTLELRTGGDSALWVDLPEGSFRRAFHADSCAEAVASMAVIAAMVLETAPAQRGALAEFPAAETTASSASGVDAVTAAANAPAALPDALPPPLPAAVALPAPAPQRVDRTRRRRDASSWAISAGAALESAVAPTPPLGFAAGVEIGSMRRTWWSPALRLSVLVTAVADIHATDGDAQFRLIAGRLAACPFRRAVTRALRVVPCADFELGSLRASGGGTALNPTSASMPWAAPGASLRAQLDLSEAVGLELAAGAKLLLRRDRFIFRPSSLVYQVPAGSFDVGAGVTVKFL
jgi:hypothetical protein